MKIKKLDMTGVKNYLFQKGERVGLLVCAVIAVFFLGIGFKNASGTSTPWAENIKKMREPLDRQISVTGKTVEEVKTPEIPPQWEFYQSNFPWTQLAPLADAPDNLRRNPTILKIMDDAKHIQVDVVVGGYLANELERGEKVVAFGDANKNAPGRAARKGAGGGTDDLTKIMKPGRMVIVSAVFPMHKQFEEYQRQLHYATLAALLAEPDYIPQPLGITVYRREVKAGVETTWDPKPVYRYNAKEDKAEVDDRITNFFREALIDDDNPKALGDHVLSGLVTPLPELANKEYRPLKLQDIHLDGSVTPKDKGTGAARWTFKRPPAGNMPFQRNGPNQGPVDTTRSHTSIPWKDLGDPGTRDKFMGKIDFFDPTGRFDAANDPQKVANPSQTTPGKRSRRGVPKAPAEPDGKIEIKDALVRFIDVDVQPGKTYQYTFCIHMANPNYEKKDVAYQELAKEKELLSPFAFSPEVTIPGEYYYYAHDERITARIEEGSDWRDAKAEPPLPYGRWNTAIQIHNWVGTVSGAHTWTVADWAIAERLLTRRGDVIGRNQVIVEVPTWNRDGGENGAFEIGFQPQNAKRKNQQTNQTGIPISFVRDAHPPLLVDFEGGKKSMVKVGGTNFPKDESAVEILVLTPDNKLIVRNSRDDADPDNPVAAARQERVDIWRQELQSLRKTNKNTIPGGQIPGRTP